MIFIGGLAAGCTATSSSSGAGRALANRSQPPSSVDANTRPLYGLDNRIEVVHAGRQVCHAGRAVPALVSRSTLQRTSDKHWKLAAMPRLQDAGWCADQRFASQPAGVICSGILIAANRIATAAHCINAADDPRGPALNCSDLAFVFDHRLNANGNLPGRYNPDQVYFCKQILAGSDAVATADWRIVELHRNTTRDPLPVLNLLPENLASLPMTIVGHPLGLPQKASTEGYLRERDSSGFFLANIDAFEGNSGSPVLVTHKRQPVVIGMLVRGEADAVTTTTQQCKVVRQCSAGECRGERVTSAHAFSRWSSSAGESLASITTRTSGFSLCL